MGIGGQNGLPSLSLPQEFGNVPPRQLPYAISNTDRRLAHFEALVEEPQNHDPRAFSPFISRYLGLRIICHRDAPARVADRDARSTYSGSTDCGAIDRPDGGSRTDPGPHCRATAPSGSQALRYANRGPERVGSVRRQPQIDR